MAAITMRRVIFDAVPVLMVVHYAEGHSSAFLGDGAFDAEDALVAAMSTVVGVDDTLAGIADLPAGWVAAQRGRRAVAAPP